MFSDQLVYLILLFNNLFQLLDVVASISSVSMVFPYMQTDMERIIRDTDIVLLPEHIKNIMAQTLCGLNYLHQSWILHRVSLFNTRYMSSILT